MKLLLFADNKVGTEITRFLLKHYLQDLVMVVTISENKIFQESSFDGVSVRVFDSDEQLAKSLVSESVDLGILVWWPRIIKPCLFKIPRLGFINTHPSLLPYNRGKHYNFWAIIEKAPFGVSLHFVDSGIDTGDIIVQKKLTYDWCDNGESLYKKAQKAMVTLFCENYPKLRRGQLKRCPQDLKKGSFHTASELEEASRIDLEATYSGRDVLNLLRARTFQGFPGCWFEDAGNKYEVQIKVRRIEK